MSDRRPTSRLGVFAAALTLAAGLAASPAAAVDKELKLAHFVPPAHILHSTLWPDMIRRIEAASAGRLKVTIYPSGQLLKINETYDGLRNGVADIGYVLFGATPGRFPAISVAELLFLFSDAKVGSRAIMQLAATGAFAKELGDVYWSAPLKGCRPEFDIGIYAVFQHATQIPTKVRVFVDYIAAHFEERLPEFPRRPEPVMTQAAAV